MTAKRSGWAFMWMALLFLGASLAVSAFVPYMGLVPTAVISELCLLVPVIYYLSRGRAGLSSQLHLKGVKPTTLLLVLVYHICCYPLVIAMNAFTMAVTDNAAMDLTGQFEGEPIFLIWFFMGLLGPVVEELAFRGVILGGLRTSGRIVTPVILSALLFGLIHMNLNQFSYTICMGFFWGLLVEASGSILTSMLCHITMNSVSVILAFVLQDNLGDMTDIINGAGSDTTAGYIATGVVFLLISVFSTALAMLMLRVISINEGRTGCFENIFRRKNRAERYGRLWSVPMLIGMVLSAAATVWVLVAG